MSKSNLRTTYFRGASVECLRSHWKKRGKVSAKNNKIITEWLAKSKIVDGNISIPVFIYGSQFSKHHQSLLKHLTK
jgi:hypothetical protein